MSTANPAPTPSHAPFADTPLIFLDLETTGTRATRDRITEIAALKVLDDVVIDRFVTLVDPGVSIPPAIVRLTGISDDWVQGQAHFEEIAHELHDWLSDGVVVAHNARFDISFLRNAFRRAGMRFETRVICTLRLSRQLAPEHRHHGLDALITRHGLDQKARHRALGDAQSMLALWRCWASRYPVEAIEAAALSQHRNRSLPANLDAHLLDEVPARPGVYLFYGHNRLPLYVGKSVNLRSRVLSHFSSDHRNDREMQISQQTQHLEWFETVGDLGAQLLEARLIKQLSPIYNHRLRRRSALVSWWWPACHRGHATNAEGPRLVGGQELGREIDGALFGMFRSRSEATRVLRQIAEAYQLCPRLLGLERGKGRCFAYQIRRCRGACCGVESLEAHGERARAALEDLRVRHWAWPGRVAFRETDAQGVSAYHLVDHWCYLGSVDDLDALPNSQEAITFDADTYRILNRFIDHPDTSIETIVLD